MLTTTPEAHEKYMTVKNLQLLHIWLYFDDLTHDKLGTRPNFLYISILIENTTILNFFLLFIILPNIGIWIIITEYVDI